MPVWLRAQVQAVSRAMTFGTYSLTRSRAADMRIGPTRNDATVMIAAEANHDLRVETSLGQRVAEWMNFRAGRSLVEVLRASVALDCQLSQVVASPYLAWDHASRDRAGLRLTTVRTSLHEAHVPTLKDQRQWSVQGLPWSSGQLGARPAIQPWRNADAARYVRLLRFDTTIQSRRCASRAISGPKHGGGLPVRHLAIAIDEPLSESLMLETTELAATVPANGRGTNTSVDPLADVSRKCQ